MASQIIQQHRTPLACRSSALIVVLLLCLQTTALEAAVREMTGYARDPDSGELQYTEQHRIEERNGKPVSHRVEYFDPAGKLIAVKTLDYQKDPFAPIFAFRDDRSGYSEGGGFSREGYEVHHQNKGEERKTTVLGPVSSRVADSGFNPYMREHLALILKGNTLRFHLAVPGRLDQFEFRVKVLRYLKSLGRRSVELEVAPTSVLLRALGDPLILHYDMETRELLVYEGTTNIFNPDNGKRYRVRVEFPLDENRLLGPEDELDDPGEVLEEEEAPDEDDEPADTAEDSEDDPDVDAPVDDADSAPPEPDGNRPLSRAPATKLKTRLYS